MAVAGIGVEGDVAHDADLGDRLLDRPGRPADQVVGVERLAAGLVAQAGVGIGKQRDDGDCEIAGPLRRLDAILDRQARDARHRGDGLRLAGALAHEDRPDQVGGRQHLLADQPAAPVGLAQAAQAHASRRGVDAVGDRNKVIRHGGCPLLRTRSSGACGRAMSEARRGRCAFLRMPSRRLPQD